jgi:hypothetical protein
MEENNFRNKFYDYIEVNDVCNLEILLKHKDYTQSCQLEYDLRSAACKGQLEIIKLLLKYNDIKPNIGDNSIINFAYSRDKIDVVSFLWKHKIIKDTLQNDNLELYNKLISKDIKDKINLFY